MKKMPPKWTDVYPQGSKEGDEEHAFFVALARHWKWTWRSTAALAEDVGISLERTEEIILKYLDKGMIFQSKKNDAMWIYWENMPELVLDVKESLVKEDHRKRIRKII